MNAHETAPGELDGLLAAPPGGAAWRRILVALDRWPGAEGLEEALGRAERALAAWPDDLREAPREVWVAIQEGAALPPWWPLVRALRLEEGDDPAPREALAGLTVLELGMQADRLDLDFLEGLPGLRSLSLWGGTITDLAPLSALRALRSLELEGAGLLEDLSPLAGLTRLRRLNLQRCPHLADLSPLAGLGELELLLLGGCESVGELGPLAGLRELRVLSVGPAEGVRSLGPLAGLAALEELVLDTPAAGDLSPLAGLPRLRVLELRGDTARADLSSLAALPSLELLRLVGAPDAALPPNLPARVRVER